MADERETQDRRRDAVTRELTRLRKTDDDEQERADRDLVDTVADEQRARSDAED